MAKSKKVATKVAKVPVKSTKGIYNFNRADWPMGAKVAYTAERVTEHKGMSGVIVGYRPTNGLWVKFPNGKGSISVKTARLLGGAVKATKASKKAKANLEPAEQISGGSEPGTEQAQQ